MLRTLATHHFPRTATIIRTPASGDAVSATGGISDFEPLLRSPHHLHQDADPSAGGEAGPAPGGITDFEPLLRSPHHLNQDADPFLRRLMQGTPNFRSRDTR